MDTQIYREGKGQTDTERERKGHTDTEKKVERHRFIYKPRQMQMPGRIFFLQARTNYQCFHKAQRERKKERSDFWSAYMIGERDDTKM